MCAETEIARQKKEIGIEDDLRPEYDLKQLLRGGVKGKYAERYKEGTNIVLLAPDVAQALQKRSKELSSAPH